ncbi:MAG: type IV pilus modification PilV family protein [Rubrivivax sp.]
MKPTPLSNRPGRGQRGVALIEALVALAVMGFGMLAVVGTIGTLRLNGDVSRQRSEALRIAQDQIEEWRGYSVLDTTADGRRMAYEDIVTEDSFTVSRANTTFTVRRWAREEADVAGTQRPQRKHVLVTVQWWDRVSDPDNPDDKPQEVRLSSTIAEADPALRAVGVAAPAGIWSRPAFGRSVTVPQGARQISEGRSVLVPPGQSGGDRVALVFNNLSGLMQRCVTPAQTTETVDEADLTVANCGSDFFLLMQGFIRFYLTPSATALTRANEMRVATDAPPVAPEVAVDRTEPLVGTDTCFVSKNGNVFEYYCVVYAFDGRGWSGSLRVDLPGFTIGGAAAEYRVCRFFPVTRIESGVSFQDSVNRNLLNQNLVITTGANTVPTNGCNLTNAAGPRVWHHQPPN